MDVHCYSQVTNERHKVRAAVTAVENVNDIKSYRYVHTLEVYSGMLQIVLVPLSHFLKPRPHSGQRERVRPELTKLDAVRARPLPIYHQDG